MYICTPISTYESRNSIIFLQCMLAIKWGGVDPNHTTAKKLLFSFPFIWSLVGLLSQRVGGGGLITIDGRGAEGKGGIDFIYPWITSAQ
jgi:hypothetical protein